MASSQVFLAAWILAVVSAAPQLHRKTPLRSQVIRHHHIIDVHHPPIQSYTVSHAPQAPHVAVGHQAAAGRAVTLRQAQDFNEDGTYNFGFETSNGISVETSAGPLTQLGPDDAVQTVTGFFHYDAPDGSPITTHWIADENGFRAEGDHLPRAPEAQ